MIKFIKYFFAILFLFVSIVLLAFIADSRLKDRENEMRDFQFKKKENPNTVLSFAKATDDNDIKQRAVIKEGIYINLDNELIYTGAIDVQGFKKLKLLYEIARVKPSVLVITSGGGKSGAGMDMGFWVYENKLDVEIPYFCASSCANFIFTAGKKKILGRNALLMWHGGSHQPNLFSQIENISNNLPNKGSYQASYAKDIKCTLGKTKEECKRIFEKGLYVGKFEESLFFYTLGLDQNIPYYGQLPHYTSKIDVTSYGGFYYSLEDMKHMGILNISVKGGKWEPELNRHYRRVYKAEILKNIHIKTDADLSMEAFREVLRDYVSLHGANYRKSDLLKWYTHESLRYY